MGCINVWKCSAEHTAFPLRPPIHTFVNTDQYNHILLVTVWADSSDSLNITMLY